jgi:hypothetical protein
MICASGWDEERERGGTYDSCCDLWIQGCVGARHAGPRPLMHRHCQLFSLCLTNKQINKKKKKAVSRKQNGCPASANRSSRVLRRLGDTIHDEGVVGYGDDGQARHRLRQPPQLAVLPRTRKEKKKEINLSKIKIRRMLKGCFEWS